MQTKWESTSLYEHPVKYQAGTSGKIVTIRGIDPDLWRQFRVRCLERGVRVSDGLNALLAESLRPGQGGR